MYNPEICIESYDMKETRNELFYMFNERKCWELMHHCVLHASENFSFYYGMDMYVIRQKNDHYVYHNVAVVTIPIGCLTTAPKNASPTRKGA